MRRARLRLAAGRPDLALEVLEQRPEGTNPAEPTTGLLLLRAEVLTALERPSEARAVYEEVLARDAKSPVALAGVGRTMLDEGRHAEAADHLRRAVAKGPPYEATYLLLAEAESGAGHLDRAEEALRQGTTALPKSAPLWVRLGEVGIARQNWAGAATAFQHALALTPDAVPTLLRAGFVADRLEHPNEALALYERATESEPQNPQAWTSRGLALLATGRPADAAASFDRALALDADFAAAKSGRKLATEKTRDQQVQKYGREALLLEARVNRPVAKNDLFVTLHVPYEFLEPVLAAIGHSPAIALDRLSAEEVRELESGSYQLITAALERRPPGIEHRGLTLADVAVL
ncbi:tetratricopeptide repeat domain-containing protein, partial [mine drainage metagenome]